MNMSFIDDMKIGKKLTAGFLILVLIAVIIACIGFLSMGSMSSSADKMYDENLQKLNELTSADASFLNMRVNTYKLVWAQDEVAEKIPESAGELTNIRSQIDSYKLRTLSAEEKTQLAIFDKNFPRYAAAYEDIARKLQAGDTKGAIAGIKSDGFSVPRDAAEDALKALEQYNRDKAQSLKEQIKSDYQNTSMIFIIITLGAIIFGILLALYLTRSIAGPIQLVKNNIGEIHKGHLSHRLKLSRKDEIGEMADTMDKFSEELQYNVVGTMKKIAIGDLTTVVKAKDSEDEISPALIQMTGAINRMANEVNVLAKAMDEGMVNTRADGTKHQGEFRKIVEGVNKTVENFFNPMKEAIRVADAFAKQDFTARFDDNVKAEGDMVKFKNALNMVGDSVSKAILAINQQVGDLAASAEEANASVEEVSAGSAHVAKNAGGVSENAEKATLGVEQVQKAMEDLSRTIQDVATKSEMVAKLVQDTTNFSREGMELAKKTEKGMQGITRSSGDVNQIILEIKGQMDKISEIVNLITDLANQTNLLALNAAIEAARAGDAGRGFAVVATEVKSLAVESRTSAERISEMIASLQKQTQNAVDAVSASNAGVREGSAALQETLSSFNNIVTSIDKISHNVSDVAAAAEEQAASVEEVTASVHEVGGLMQATTKEATDAAAASEESSAAIDQITKVVANLNTIVDKVTREVSRFKC